MMSKEKPDKFKVIDCGVCEHEGDDFACHDCDNDENISRNQGIEEYDNWLSNKDSQFSAKISVGVLKWKITTPLRNLVLFVQEPNRGRTVDDIMNKVKETEEEIATAINQHLYGSTEPNTGNGANDELS